MAMVLEDLKGLVAGTCVSGGLDSRTIAKVMMEAGVKVIGFTGGIPMRRISMMWPSGWRPPELKP